jgi:Flp pilus assembly protein, pilin Flp
MKKMLASFLENRSGATAIEYGLIATFLSVALIIGAQTLGGTINNSMANTATVLESHR